MSRVCVLTDSTAQFPARSFPGRELVTVLPMHILLGEQDFLDSKDLKLGNLPLSAKNGLHPRLLPPTPLEFRQAIEELGQAYRDIILILLSSHLVNAVDQAAEAIHQTSSPANISIVDSQSIAAGLGFLVQIAAEAASQNLPAGEILRRVRGQIPHIYGLFCLQSLTYLTKAGQLDPAQALIGEMLGITPFFLLENGRLIPIQKARSSRHFVDTFHEFISEFSELKHLALIHEPPPFLNEARHLHERIVQEFPTTPFSEYPLSAALAALFGPSSLGLIAVEKIDRHEHRNRYR